MYNGSIICLEVIPMKYTTWSVQRLNDKKGKPWQAIAQYKEDGKWRHKTRLFRQAQGKKEAEKLAEEWFDELNEAAKERPDVDETLTAVLEKYLDNQLNRKLIESSTKYQQEKGYRTYGEPYIGDLGFSSIDRNDIEKWITALHNKGYSKSTIYGVYTTVRKVFNHYYTLGEIRYNPCLGLKVQKGDPKQSHLTPEQFNNFIACVNLEYEPEEAMYSALFLAAYAALRPQEILALRWRDINFTTGLLTVSSAVGKDGDGDYLKNPKNKTSARQFPMVEQLQKVLEYRYDKIKPKNSWFVVGDKEEHLTISMYNKNFIEFRDAYELTDVYGRPLSSHLLRHNVGMLGIQSGMDISSLSKMFGHSSRAMTLDRYGDASPDAARVASDKLSKIIKKSELDE